MPCFIHIHTSVRVHILSPIFFHSVLPRGIPILLTIIRVIGTPFGSTYMLTHQLSFVSRLFRSILEREGGKEGGADGSMEAAGGQLATWTV